MAKLEFQTSNSVTAAPVLIVLCAVALYVAGCSSEPLRIPEKDAAPRVVSPDWDRQQGWMTKQNDGEFLLFVQRFNHADGRFREAVQLAEKFGVNDARVARSLTGLGRAQAGHNDWQSALIQYERALAIKRKSYGNDHIDVADLLTNIAAARCQLNQVKESRAALDEAKAIWKRINASTIPETLYIEALVKDKEGSPGAEEAFKRATDMFLDQIKVHKYPQPTVSMREAKDCGERYCVWLDTHGKQELAKQYRSKLQPVNDWLNILGQS